MGCLSSTEAQNDFEANEDFDDEEKEAKPTGDKNYGDEIPEMNVNQLGSSNQPLKSDNNQQIQVTQYQNDNNMNNNNNNNNNNMSMNMNSSSQAANRRGMAQQASVLNNFNNNNNNRNNYDINQYHSPGSEHSTASKDYSDDNNRNNLKTGGGIPEHRMLDSHGNVHVNKFYNVTRNHNLSNASKLTDLSEMPSVAAMQNPAQIQSQHGGHGSNDMAGFQHMHNLSVMNNNGLSPVQYGASGGGHKMSVDSHASGTTNGSKMLWDDFSDRGSVMTADTETV